MKQGECWCDEGKVVNYLWVKEDDPIIGIDGKEALLWVRISKEHGRVGLPIEFCPFCGRQLADGSPRCPEGEES